LPDSSSILSQVFERLVGSPSAINSSPATSINMIEALKKREDINNQTPEINETPEVSEPPKVEHRTKTPELDTQETIVQKTNNEASNKEVITSQGIINGTTSINTIEAINLSASIKEEVPPLSMVEAINLSASINLREVITVPATKGETSIPNEILDGLLPLLDPTASLVYLRLYRLSYGFKSEQCTVGMNKLASSVNIGVATAERAVRKLESVGLIERKGANFGHGIKGNHYIVRKPSTSINMREAINMSDPIKTREAINASDPINLRDNKDHDDHDDLKRHDHHLGVTEHKKEVMMIYQKVTGNNWSEKDHTSYKRIDKIPIEIIETAMRIAKQRAASHPNSLSYFIKEILNAFNPAPANRAQQKKKMERIVDTVLTSYVGSNSYTLSDVAYRVKELCIKQDIPFDNDIFDECLAKRKH
jgi:DNA-binding Lrp family transcriptional regulator